ncbi:MAG TPA: VOC family protein [Saprospiraceae bacterium]|nr:VOC family protein [Saprospiraceae bacterium]HMP24005.1 VOC family protein [Saprospiraceae bacterium]
MQQLFSYITLCFFAILLSISLRSQTAQELARVGITVSNLEQAIQFYENVLSFKHTGSYQLNKASTKSLFGTKGIVKIATLQLGDEAIELLEFSNAGRPVPADSRSSDLWFQHIAIVVADMEAAFQHLRRAKVQFVSTAPQVLPEYLPAAAGIEAFYFRDPDGHNLELIHFPKGKGNEKWQLPTDQLFLGIDHTAIGIQDTDESTRFYQNLLGLKVAGHSENYGTEQEHLNQVFGAHLIITGLQAQQGFGLEFLQYLAPPGGRPYPAGSKANDRWHWHTTIFVPHTDARTTQAQGKKAATVFTHPTWGEVNASLIRDPDGHAVLMMKHHNPNKHNP